MVSWKAGAHSAPMGCISSINCVVVYRLCNVAALDHKGTDEATTLLPFAVQTYMLGHLHSECHLKDSFKAPASAVPPSQTPGCLNLNVQILLFVSISFCVLPFKDTRSACFLKCSSA